MRNFQQKRGWRNVIESKPFLVLFGILILFFAWNIFTFWSKMKETEKNKEIIQNKVEALKLQKEKLASAIESLETDRGKEKLFRENFGLAKEGEGLIVVVEDRNHKEPSKIEPPSGFFDFLRNWFK